MILQIGARVGTTGSRAWFRRGVSSFFSLAVLFESDQRFEVSLVLFPIRQTFRVVKTVSVCTSIIATVSGDIEKRFILYRLYDRVGPHAIGDANNTVFVVVWLWCYLVHINSIIQHNSSPLRRY